MTWRKEFVKLKEIPDFEDACPRWKCAHERSHPTRYVQRNGISYVRHQCQHCGASVKGPKKAELEKQGYRIAALLPWDEALARRWSNRLDHFQQTQRPFQARLDLYQQYLLSDTWKFKRARVLQRDDHQCQACCSAKAVEVHHKSYQNIGDEPLFELISVCKECHLQLHQKSPFFGQPEAFLPQGPSSSG